MIWILSKEKTALNTCLFQEVRAETTRSNDDDNNLPSTSTSVQAQSQLSSSSTPSGSQTNASTSKKIHQTKVNSFFNCPSKISVRQKDKIDRKLLCLCIKDLQPFSLVTDTGFKEFVAALNPAYHLPDRHNISKTLLPAFYEECLTHMKNLIVTGKTFCITTDGWTSTNNTSFVAITAHFLNDEFKLISILLECSATEKRHTAENLATDLQKVVSKWGIQDKINFAVSDNAANIQKALQLLKWKNMGCIAHTLNLIVKDGLKNEKVTSILEKVRGIVCHFKRSTISNNKLLKYQENEGNDNPLKVILDVVTRWNSTYYMLERFIQLEEAIKSTIAIIEKELPVLTVDEWKIIKELCLALKPFDDASKTLSGDKYCTTALVIPICSGLQNIYLKLLNQRRFSEVVNDVVQLFHSGLQQRLGNVERSNTLSTSTFLDPKFKQIAFSDKVIAESTKNRLTELIAKKIREETSECKNNIIVLENKLIRPANHEKKDEDLSIWGDFDKMVASTQPKGTFTSRAIIEMQRYLEEEIIPRTSDSFLWWKQHRQMFPYLSKIAQEQLCTLATSVPCERLFSTAGQVLSDRRTRLSSKNVEMILFLNVNVKLMKED